MSHQQKNPSALHRYLTMILETIGGEVGSLEHGWMAELRWERVHLDELPAALEQWLKQRTQTLEPYHCLRTIPGIGVLRASALVSAVTLANKIARTTSMVLTRRITYQVPTVA